jgi:ATP-dependent DNA helicase MPH1
MCYTYLQELASDKGDVDGKKDAKAQKLRTNPKFQALVKEIETQRNKGFSLHPKMDILKGLVVQHFGERLADEGENQEETRAMVFVTYRECVDEIVEMLNAEMPLIRATKFVGQGTDKQGKKGFGQKEQLEVSLFVNLLCFA